nr:DUF1559 domain-containing protein [Roseimaritima sediminicola]
MTRARTRLSTARRPAKAFTLVELLVTIGIIGVLVGLLLPAVQAVREAARRMQCQNNLHQVGIALHHYHDVHSTLPAGGIQPRPFWPDGKQLAWSAFLLPYLEQETVHEEIDFNYAFDHPVNESIAATPLSVYMCPSTPRSEPLNRGLGATDYGGIYGERIVSRNDPPSGVMIYDEAMRFRDITDGLSGTLAVSEDAGFPDGQWINARNLFDQGYRINKAPAFENDIRSFHPAGAEGLFADGSARFLDESMDLRVLAAICTRNGGEVVPNF